MINLHFGQVLVAHLRRLIVFKRVRVQVMLTSEEANVLAFDIDHLIALGSVR